MAEQETRVVYISDQAIKTAQILFFQFQKFNFPLTVTNRSV
jgi:hypothetical protein